MSLAMSVELHSRFSGGHSSVTGWVQAGTRVRVLLEWRLPCVPVRACCWRVCHPAALPLHQCMLATAAAKCSEHALPTPLAPVL